MVTKQVNGKKQRTITKMALCLNDEKMRDGRKGGEVYSWTELLETAEALYNFFKKLNEEKKK